MKKNHKKSESNVINFKKQKEDHKHDKHDHVYDDYISELSFDLTDCPDHIDNVERFIHGF